MSTFAAILLVLMVAATVIVLGACRLAKLISDEESSSDRDAGVRHVCFNCGTHLRGPTDGAVVRDLICVDCYVRFHPGEHLLTYPSYVETSSQS